MRYFSLREMYASTKANENNIDNTPPLEIKAHLVELVDELLDPLREAWGSPINVNSGYRCKVLNTLVGGSPTSAHLSGYAADLVPSNKKIREFKAFVVKWLKENNIAFDQCICETNSRGSQWVHLGLKGSNGKQRKQFLNMNVI